MAESLDATVKSEWQAVSPLSFERPQLLRRPRNPEKVKGHDSHLADSLTKDCKPPQYLQDLYVSDKAVRKVADRRGGNITAPLRRPRCSAAEILKKCNKVSGVKEEVPEPFEVSLVKEDVPEPELVCSKNQVQQSQVDWDKTHICFPGYSISHKYHEGVCRHLELNPSRKLLGLHYLLRKIGKRDLPESCEKKVPEPEPVCSWIDDVQRSRKDRAEREIRFSGESISQVYHEDVCKHLEKNSSGKSLLHLKEEFGNIVSVNNAETEEYSNYADEETPVPDDFKEIIVGDGTPVINENITLEGKIVFTATAPRRESLSRPVGVAQFESGKTVVADTFNNRIVMFDEYGSFVCSFSSPGGLRRPSAIVILVDGSFAVKDNISITVFSELCKVVAIKKLKRPYGLTLNDAGNLVTVETNMPGYIVIVTINPETCGLVSKVTVDLCLDQQESMKSKPRFITWQGDSRLLVVDLGLNCVYILDAVRGEVISSFGEFGTGDGQMNDPSGIVCDAEGFILLGDSRNHRILMFSPDGEFMSVVKMDVPLNRPSGLFMTSDGNLLVLNYWDNSVAQYKLNLYEESAV